MLYFYYFVHIKISFSIQLVSLGVSNKDFLNSNLSFFIVFIEYYKKIIYIICMCTLNIYVHICVSTMFTPFMKKKKKRDISRLLRYLFNLYYIFQYSWALPLPNAYYLQQNCLISLERANTIFFWIPTLLPLIDFSAINLAYILFFFFFIPFVDLATKLYPIIYPPLVKYSLYNYQYVLTANSSNLIRFLSSFSISHQIIIMLPSCLSCWLCTLYLPVKDLDH